MSNGNSTYYSTDLKDSPMGYGKKSRADLNHEKIEEIIEEMGNTHMTSYLYFLLQQIDDNRLAAATANIKSALEEFTMTTPKHRAGILDVMGDPTGNTNGYTSSREEQDEALLNIFNITEELFRSLHARKTIIHLAKCMYVFANIMQKRDTQGKTVMEMLTQMGFITDDEKYHIESLTKDGLPLEHAPVLMAGLIDLLRAQARAIAIQYNKINTHKLLDQNIENVVHQILHTVGTSATVGLMEQRIKDIFENSGLLPENYEFQKGLGEKKEEGYQISNFWTEGGYRSNASPIVTGVTQAFANPQADVYKDNIQGVSMVFGGASRDHNRAIVHDVNAYNDSLVNNYNNTAYNNNYSNNNTQGMTFNNSEYLGNNNPNVMRRFTGVDTIKNGLLVAARNEDGNVNRLERENFYDMIKKGRSLGDTVYYTEEQCPFEGSHVEYTKDNKILTVFHSRENAMNGRIFWQIPLEPTTAIAPERRNRIPKGEVDPNYFDYNWRPDNINEPYTVKFTNGDHKVWNPMSKVWEHMSHANSMGAGPNYTSTMNPNVLREMRKDGYNLPQNQPGNDPTGPGYYRKHGVLKPLSIENAVVDTSAYFQNQMSQNTQNNNNTRVYQGNNNQNTQPQLPPVQEVKGEKIMQLAKDVFFSLTRVAYVDNNGRVYQNQTQMENYYKVATALGYNTAATQSVQNTNYNGNYNTVAQNDFGYNPNNAQNNISNARRNFGGQAQGQGDVFGGAYGNNQNYNAAYSGYNAGSNFQAGQGQMVAVDKLDDDGTVFYDASGEQYYINIK